MERKTQEQKRGNGAGIARDFPRVHPDAKHFLVSDIPCHARIGDGIAEIEVGELCKKCLWLRAKDGVCRMTEYKATVTGEIGNDCSGFTPVVKRMEQGPSA